MSRWELTLWTPPCSSLTMVFVASRSWQWLGISGPWVWAAGAEWTVTSTSTLRQLDLSHPLTRDKWSSVSTLRWVWSGDNVDSSFMIRSQLPTSGVSGSPRSSVMAPGQSRLPQAASSTSLTPRVWSSPTTMMGDSTTLTSTTGSASSPPARRVSWSSGLREPSCWRSGETSRQTPSPGPGSPVSTVSRNMILEFRTKNSFMIFLKLIFFYCFLNFWITVLKDYLQIPGGSSSDGSSTHDR